MPNAEQSFPFGKKDVYLMEQHGPIHPLKLNTPVMKRDCHIIITIQ
jgi:hypothetical protein